MKSKVNHPHAFRGIEGLESRTLMSVVPLSVGTVDAKPTLWSVDTNGAHIEKLASLTSTNSRDFVTYHGMLYFRSGPQLFKSDGTKAGTAAIAGAVGYSSYVSWMGMVDGNLYYVKEGYDHAQYETYGNLYYVDSAGASHGIAPYAAIYPRVIDGHLYFTSERYLPLVQKFYSVNGATASQIDKLPSGVTDQPLPPLPDTIQAGSTAFYSYDDGTHGAEPWMDNGAGGTLVHDLFPGSGSSSPVFAGAINNRVLIVAGMPSAEQFRAAVSGGTLFVSGGMALPNHIVVASSNGITTVSISIPDVPDTYVSTFNDSDFTNIVVTGQNRGDWINIADTTKPATVIGGDGDDTIIGNNNDDSLEGGAGNNTIYKTAPVQVGNAFYFTEVSTAADQGIDLYKADLDGFNKTLLKHWTGKNAIGPNQLTAYHGMVFFSANWTNIDYSGQEPWRTDGTPDGTFELNEIYGGAVGSNPHDFMILNDHLLFLARNSSVRDQLFTSDGTPEGTVQLINPPLPGYYSSMTNYLVTDHLIFAEVYSGNNQQIERWQTDGTVDGTVRSSGGLIQDGTLRIFGTDTDDNIQVSSDGAVTTISGAGAGTQSFNNADFSSILVNSLKGNDRIQLDSSIFVNATLSGGDGIDSIYGGSGNDTIVDNGPGSFIYGAAGNDSLQGAGHVDGGVGNDTINGFGQLSGGDGNDRITVDPAPNNASKIYGGAGDDTIFGGVGHDRVYGGDGNDWMSGDAGNDTLYGEAGNDRIFGGDGKDYLDGGAGNNVLRGEGGQDRIIASKIRDDYRSNAGDLITLLTT